MRISWIRSVGRPAHGAVAGRPVIAAPFVLLLGASLASPAAAQQTNNPLLDKAPLSAGGFYFRAEDAWQQVNLPRFDLGFKSIDASTPVITVRFPDSNFDPRGSGNGFAGAFGYAFVNGTRVEVGGSYLKTDISQSDKRRIATSLSDRGTVILLDGSSTNGFHLDGIGVPLTSSLQTGYKTWNANGTLATDIKAGGMTLTPSVAIFGGRTETNQALAQRADFDPAAGVIYTYRANTALDWRDLGIRAGANVSVDVAPWLTLGVGGHIGVADRRVSLSGNDSASIAGNFATAINIGDHAIPTVANAQASLGINILSGIVLRGFAGLNYDSRVPGIEAPTSTNLNSVTVPKIPASIKFADETNYYAGGGLTVKFAP